MPNRSSAASSCRRPWPLPTSSAPFSGCRSSPASSSADDPARLVARALSWRWFAMRALPVLAIIVALAFVAGAAVDRFFAASVQGEILRRRSPCTGLAAVCWPHSPRSSSASRWCRSRDRASAPGVDPDGTRSSPSRSPAGKASTRTSSSGMRRSRGRDAVRRQSGRAIAATSPSTPSSGSRTEVSSASNTSATARYSTRTACPLSDAGRWSYRVASTGSSRRGRRRPGRRHCLSPCSSPALSSRGADPAEPPAEAARAPGACVRERVERRRTAIAIAPSRKIAPPT